MPLSWELLADRLLDREWRPTAVIEADGRVAKTNQAFRELAADYSLRDLSWLGEGSREPFRQQLSAKPLRSRLFVTLATGHHVDIALERLAGATVVTVLGVVPFNSGPLTPVASTTYEVAFREGHAPQVVRRSPPAESPEAPCWKQIFGRSTACLDCPVGQLQSNPALQSVTAVMSADERSLSAAVVSAERRAPGLFGVSAWTVDGATFDKIVTQRMAGLSRRADLTAQEETLFALLVKGTDVEKVAQNMKITPRTVKYHQQNLLQKLGVKSRQLLCRLVLGQVD